MQVEFGLFDVDRLPGLRGSEGDDYREGLGNAESYVGDTDHIACATLRRFWQPTDHQFHPSVIEVCQ
jgi:hypothetical protein